MCQNLNNDKKSNNVTCDYFQCFFLIFIFLGNEFPEGWRGGSLQAEISHISNLPQTGKFPSTIISCSSRLFKLININQSVQRGPHDAIGQSQVTWWDSLSPYYINTWESPPHGHLRPFLPYPSLPTTWTNSDMLTWEPLPFFTSIGKRMVGLQLKSVLVHVRISVTIQDLCIS